MEQRAFGEGKPCPGRLQLRDDERGDVVRVAGVAIVILAARAFGDRGEELERDIALLQAGQILMPAIGLPENVALPHQRVGMEIDDAQRGVQRLCLGRDGDEREAIHLVGAGFEDAGRQGEKADGGEADQAQKAPHPFAHIHPPTCDFPGG